MKRIQLRFDSIQQIVGGEGISVIVLTDMERKNALSVVCDGHMSHQLLMRVNNIKECDNKLPETLVGLLKDKFELMGLHLKLLRLNYRSLLLQVSRQP